MKRGLRWSRGWCWKKRVCLALLSAAVTFPNIKHTLRTISYNKNGREIHNLGLVWVAPP